MLLSFFEIIKKIVSSMKFYLNAIFFFQNLSEIINIFVFQAMAAKFKRIVHLSHTPARVFSISQIKYVHSPKNHLTLSL